MSETAYAMWNPTFMRRIWNKRRKAAGLPEKANWQEEAQEKQHRLRRPSAERAAEVAMKLSASELAALLADMGLCEASPIHASRGGEDTAERSEA